ncbi:MAG: hypothetical protein EKK57_09720 [Proteobacteria bacterium]|nr:MAG: hypothetical protein EKK57_09720 [Pseudomonadota bacterium]
MFKKPSVSTTIIPLITLDNLGSDKKTPKGVFNFIPLFRATKDGPGLSLEEIQEGIFGWYLYQVRTKGDEPGKIKSNRVSWIDSGLRAGEDGGVLNDPGVTLGLSATDKYGNVIANKDRKNIMGFGVPGLGFQDPLSYRATVRIPVLWDVQPNKDSEGNIDPASGVLALLELKANQLRDLVDEMKKVAKPGVTYEADGMSNPEKYPYQGYGYAYNLNKDKSRGMDTYQWSKTDLTTSKVMWESRLIEAEKLFSDYKANAFKMGRPYEDVVQECMNGQIPFEEAERIVVATIAKKLLDSWGVSYGDTTDDILATFEEVTPNFSYHAGAGISQAAVGKVQRVEIPEDEESEGDDQPF